MALAALALVVFGAFDSYPICLFTFRYSKEPAFISRPISIEVEEGDPLDIVCEVIGDPNPEVLLEKDFLKVSLPTCLTCWNRN